MTNPWNYPRAKSHSVRNTLVLHYHNLRKRLALSVSGDLLQLIDLRYYPPEGEITDKVKEIIELMPESDWKNKIYSLDYRVIKKIAEKLVELDFMIDQAYWDYELDQIRNLK